MLLICMQLYKPDLCRNTIAMFLQVFIRKGANKA